MLILEIKVTDKNIILNLNKRNGTKKKKNERKKERKQGTEKIKEKKIILNRD